MEVRAKTQIEHEYHLVSLHAAHQGSSWRRRGPEAIDLLYRCVSLHLDPVTVVTEEEKAWFDWNHSNDKDGKNPPDVSGSDLFVDGKPVHLPAAFSDVEAFTCRLPQRKHWVNMGTRGPAELQGHKWRETGVGAEFKGL